MRHSSRQANPPVKCNQFFSSINISLRLRRKRGLSLALTGVPGMSGCVSPAIHTIAYPYRFNWSQFDCNRLCRKLVLGCEAGTQLTKQHHTPFKP